MLSVTRHDLPHLGSVGRRELRDHDRMDCLLRGHMGPAELHDASDDTPHERANDFIHHSGDAPPVAVPRGYVGPIYMPCTGRMVWWTGRVAIGLRHQPPEHSGEVLSESACWLQRVVLAKSWRGVRRLASSRARWSTEKAALNP